MPEQSLPLLIPSSDDEEEDEDGDGARTFLAGETPRFEPASERLMREGSEVICMTMSKRELVREVRKQKQEHQKRIR